MRADILEDSSRRVPEYHPCVELLALPHSLTRLDRDALSRMMSPPDDDMLRQRFDLLPLLLSFLCACAIAQYVANDEHFCRAEFILLFIFRFVF